MNIGIDGSGSMLGFVSRQGTRYGQAIDSLSTLIAAKGLSGQTTYWRLGNGEKTRGPQQIDQGRFLQARTPEFYCHGGKELFPCVSSTLDQLYELPISAPQERLDVLLTDLEPDSGAIGNLTQKYSDLLKENPDYKVTLLGVRSEYDGPVYPAQKDAFKPFLYSTEGRNVDQVGRPFYVIISGPPSAVDAIAETFRALPMQVSQAFRAVSFSKQLSSSDIVTLDRQATWAHGKTSDCLSEISAFNRTVPGEPEQWLLGAIRPACSGTKHKFTITSEQSPTLIGADLPASAFQLSGEDRAVQISKVDANEGRLSVELELNPQILASLSQPAPIRLDLDRKSLNQALWKGWDTSVASPAGPQTQNLMLFISSMETLTAGPEKSDPALRFCMGIEAEVRRSADGRPPLLLIILPLIFLLLAGGGFLLARVGGDD